MNDSTNLKSVIWDYFTINKVDESKVDCKISDELKPDKLEMLVFLCKNLKLIGDF